MLEEFNHGFWRAFGVACGVVTGLECMVLLLALCFMLDTPKFRIVQFKRYSENLNEGESSAAPSSDSPSAAD